MYHSIIISGKNTYDEWEMYPTSRPHVAQPEVKTSYVDLPGANGGLDYTELLTGEPTYGYRKGSWEFLLIPQDQWSTVYRDLVDYLHGREHVVILEDDPLVKYTGRLSVNKWQSAAHNSLITIDYILDPVPTYLGPHDDPYEQLTFDLAKKELLKPANSGKVITLNSGNSQAILATKESLFDDGDLVSY